MGNSCIKPEGDGDQMKKKLEHLKLYYIRMVSDGERLWYPELRSSENEEGSKNT